jgi:neutral ceramidase
MNLARRVFLKFALPCLLLVVSILDTCAAQLAGWSEIEITPPIGIALGGRGAAGAIPSKEVLDPLYAQVLFIQDNEKNRFALVSFDIVGMPPDLGGKIRRSIVHELGVPWNLVVLNCSHTHSGPNVLREILAGVPPHPQNEIDYFHFLHEKIITAARAAEKNLKPVRIEAFDGTSQVAINRRGKNKKGQVGILPNPDGPIDDHLWVLKLTPQDGGPPAIVFSYACHAVIVYGYKGAAISADFPGMARKVLRASVGEKAHVQFVQGLAGDVRPRAVADLEKMTFSRGGPDALQKAGTDLANDVLAAMKKDGRSLNLEISAASDRPFLPRGNPPPRDYYDTILKSTKNQADESMAKYWLERYDSGYGFAKGDAWPVGLIRLAQNQWIVYFAGEPVVEWHAKISQWLPGKNFVPFGYSQEANTYLPTEKLLPEGGYEVLECNRARASSPAPFAPGIEDAVRTSLLRQLSFINAPIK